MLHNRPQLLCFKSVLKIKIQCSGLKHASVASTEDNIGIVLMKMGDLQNALLRHQKALDIKTLLAKLSLLVEPEIDKASLSWLHFITCICLEPSTVSAAKNNEKLIFSD